MNGNPTCLKCGGDGFTWDENICSDAGDEYDPPRKFKIPCACRIAPPPPPISTAPADPQFIEDWVRVDRLMHPDWK